MPTTRARRLTGALLVVLAVAAVVRFTLGRESSRDVRDSSPSAAGRTPTAPSPLAPPLFRPPRAPGSANPSAARPPNARGAAPAVVVRSGGAPLSALHPQRVHFIAAATHMSLGDVGWEIEGASDADGRPVVDRGQADADGHTTLPPAALSSWAEHPLSVWVGGGTPTAVAIPVTGFDPATELQLEIVVEGVPVRIAGTLLDEAGRPIPHGGVYLDDGNAVAGQPGAEAGGDGHFVLDFLDWKPSEGSVAEPESEQRPFTLYAVAVGFGLTTTTVPRRGADALKIRLAPSAADGSLSLRLFHTDGSPATDARAWVWPEGRPFSYTSRVFDDAEGGRRRGLLARLRGGGWFDGQGMNISEENDVNDLRADANGEIRVASLPIGSYRVLAIARATRRGSPIPIEETISDDWNARADGDGVAAGEVFEGTCHVTAPPQETVVDVRLPRARRVTGRIVVDEREGWTTPGAASHRIDIAEWPWVHWVVETGPRDEGEPGAARTGAFDFAGLPREACRIYVHGASLGTQTIEVPAALPGRGDVVDLGIVHVRNGRPMTLTLMWTDGSTVDDSAVQLSLERAGGRVELGYYISKSLSPPTVDFVATLIAPPAVGDMLVVEVKGEPDRVFRFPLHFEAPERLEMTITLPAPPPSKPGAEATTPHGDSGSR